jgi:hypothetical protein
LGSDRPIHEEHRRDVAEEEALKERRRPALPNAQSHGDEEGATARGEDVPERRALLGVGNFGRGGENRGFIQLAADDESDDRNEHTRNEWDSPAPGEQCFLGQQRQRQPDSRSEKRPGIGSDRYEGRDKSPTFGRCILGQKHRRSSKFRPSAEALHEPEHDEQDRGDNAYLIV